VSDGLRAILGRIDDALGRSGLPAGRFDLVILGRSALILRYGLRDATKDLDIVTGVLPADVEEMLLRQFGRGTRSARRLDLFLESVSSGLPPLPNDFRERSVEIPGEWKHLRLFVLDPHHLVISKLARFHAKDREDIRFLADRGELRIEELQRALEGALSFTSEDDPKYGTMHANLGRVTAYLDGTAAAL
jgi:hypothetical protein